MIQVTFLALSFTFPDILIVKKKILFVKTNEGNICESLCK